MGGGQILRPSPPGLPHVMSDALRIAMTSYYLPTGSKIGVGYQAHALANGLQDRGHEVTLFSPCGPCGDARYRSVQVPSGRRFRTFGFAQTVRRLDLSGFDVLHAHGDDYWLWRRRVPAHVRTMHGSCFAEAIRVPRVREKIRMAALGLSEVAASLVADRTVLVSPQTRRWFPWVKTILPNGVDERIFYPDASARTVDPTILFVGTYANRKRGRLLMETFEATIRGAVPGARLTMVCEDAPSAEGVSVTGRVTEAELAALYRSSWAFCLPSTYEGFGIPYAEALASGVPVVASSNPGSRFVLADGRYGDIVADEEIGGRLVELLTNEDEWRNAAERARSGASEYRLDEVIARYEEIYAELLARRM
jgi:phosphatidyl-myo-inositol alpha-mannosyltransferase